MREERRRRCVEGYENGFAQAMNEQEQEQEVVMRSRGLGLGFSDDDISADRVDGNMILMERKQYH